MRTFIKVLGFLSLLGGILYLHRVDLEGVTATTKEPEEPKISLPEYFDRQNKYAYGGSFELVTFHSCHDEKGNTCIKRSGILYKATQPKANIIVCHGFMCTKIDVGFLRKALFDNYNVLIFDFRAHGDNVDDFQYCTFGRDEALDVIGAVKFVQSRADLKHLPRIAYGFSMGAVAAVQAQAQDSTLFEGMILDCPFDRSDTVLRKSIENLRFSVAGYTFDIPGRLMLERFAYNSLVQSFLKALLKTIAHMDATKTNTCIYPLSPVDSIKSITVPCFLIHCKKDEKISLESARNLFDAAAGFKRLWITNGRNHFDSYFYNPEKYRYKVHQFIDHVLQGTHKNIAQAKIIKDANI